MSSTLVALWLATRHARAAGQHAPWAWASTHRREFLNEAARPDVSARVAREMEDLAAADAAADVLAVLLAGPPPAPDAPLAAHLDYTKAVLQECHGAGLPDPGHHDHGQSRSSACQPRGCREVGPHRA